MPEVNAYRPSGQTEQYVRCIGVEKPVLWGQGMPYSARSENPIGLESVTAYFLYALTVGRKPYCFDAVIGISGSVNEKISGIVIEWSPETSEYVFPAVPWKQEWQRIDQITEYVCQVLHSVVDDALVEGDVFYRMSLLMLRYCSPAPVDEWQIMVLLFNTYSLGAWISCGLG